MTPSQAVPQAFSVLADLGLEPLVERTIQHARSDCDGELLLGRIDHDGRLFGSFGGLPGMVSVPASAFVTRKRFDLDLVLVGGRVLLKKNYRGSRAPFLHEWRTLDYLSGKVNVPPIHHVDESNCVLYRGLVPGRTIREILVDHGARILLTETESDPELAGLEWEARLETVYARGRAVISKCISEHALQQIRNQVKLIHRLKVLGVSHTYGNVVIHHKTGEPWFIDLDKARLFSSTLSPRFLLKRARERGQLRRLYG